MAENIYDRDFELTRQGRGILPLQTLVLSYVVTSFAATEYGVNDKWANCPNLGQFTGYIGTVLNASERRSEGAEERRSGGAEERRSGGAEERRSGGAEERRSGERGSGGAEVRRSGGAEEWRCSPEKAQT